MIGSVGAAEVGTRERLVRATREAIRDLGTPAVTARRITARANANLASIPYHFGSKDALVAEALVAEARDLVAPVLDLLASDEPGPERAAAAVVMLTDLFDRSRAQVPVYLAALASTPHDEAVAEGIGSLWRELRAGLAADVARQLDSRTLPAWVDPDAMAALILALVNGVVVASVADPGGPDHRAVAAQFLSLLLATGSVVGPPGAEPEAPQQPAQPAGAARGRAGPAGRGKRRR